jgi:hypothetical protein
VLHKAHPEYEYAALVRSKEKAELVSKAYPSIRIVLGGLDDYELLKQEASKADIVLRMFLSPLRGNGISVGLLFL